MSAIREELTLSDKFSGALDRYIRKMEQAAARTVESQTAADRMTAATEDMVKNLSGLEGAVHSAFTDNEADAALKRLQKEMERTGLVWTNEADRMESADLLVRVGLERLAEEGRIAASAMAEEAARADQAAAAQERHEGRVSKLTKALFGVASGAKSAVASMLGFNKAKNPIDSINNRLSRTILYFFSVRKLIRYVTDAIERAPNDTAGSFTKLKSMASDTFARTIVSAMASMKDGVDQLNAATITSPTKVTVNISAAVTLATGYTLDQVTPIVKASLEAYLLSVRKSWGEQLGTTEVKYAANVYISRILASIVSTTGIVNAVNVQLNGQASDLILIESGSVQQVPVLGEVTLSA